MMEKICEICGKKFLAARGNHKYCSAECSAKGKTIKDKKFHEKKKQLIRESLVERICPICGATFKPRSERQLCCCKPCGQKLYSRKRQTEEGKKQALANREAREATAASTALTKHQRRCHDCGKPCTNYRCTSCWRKRAQKYKFSAEEIVGR